MDVLMPQLGETVAEGKITRWFKSVGDKVAGHGDTLFEVETDKVTVEVPSISAGILQVVNVDAGAIARVGAIVAVVGDGSAAPAAKASAPARAGDEGRRTDARSAAGQSGRGRGCGPRSIGADGPLP